MGAASRCRRGVCAFMRQQNGDTSALIPRKYGLSPHPARIRARSSAPIPSDTKNSSCATGACRSNSACHRSIAASSIPPARNNPTHIALSTIGGRDPVADRRTISDNNRCFCRNAVISRPISPSRRSNTRTDGFPFTARIDAISPSANPAARNAQIRSNRRRSRSVYTR